MSVVRTIQTNFSSGELDPRMAGREDTSVYANGAETLTNSAPLVQGGVRRRPGTSYLATLQGIARLERMQFNETQLYIFAFTNTRLDIYDEDGAAVTNLTSQPWDATTMWEMRLDTSGDTTIIVHKDFIMKKLLRTGASTFTISDFAFEAHSTGYPRYNAFYKFADPAVTITPSATSGTGITLTTSANYWVSAHVGSIVRIGSTPKECDITGYTSATQVTATVRETLANTDATVDWDENVFSAAKGYARSVVFHQQRLWFGGSDSLSSNIWSSKKAAYFNFDVGTAAANESIQVDIGTNIVNEIRHLHSGRHLQIFTDQSAGYVVESDASPVSPTNFIFRSQVPYGCSNVAPKNLDGATIFIQDTKKVVREMIYAEIQNAYTADAVSLISNSMITSARDLTMLYGHSAGPEQFALVVNEDTEGSISIFHSIRSEKIAGWYKWVTDGQFISATTLNEEVFVCVQRDNKNVRENGTITVTDYGNIATGTTIIVTIADGTSYTFTSEAAGSSSPSSATGWRPYSSNNTTADNIYTCINSHSVFTVANPAANVLTITETNPTGLLTITTSDSTRLAVSAQTYEQKYFLEKFDWDKTVDSSKALTLSSGTTWGGLTHLLNSSASITDGTLYHGDFTVNGSGQVVLTETATAPVGGLNYTRTIKDLPVVVADSSGPYSGEYKRVGRVVLNVFETVQFAVNGYDFQVRQVTDDLSIAPTSKTGRYEFALLGWDRAGQVSITQEAPLPFTLLSIYKEVTV